MVRKLLIPGLALLAIFAVGAIVFVPWLAVQAHQRAVTQELLLWEAECGRASTTNEAIRTAQMIRYVQAYYPPSDGYRGSEASENALQSQRQKTIDAMIGSLKSFTGEDFGENADEWLAYLKSNQTSD
jgi:hypothetical protein